MAVAALEDIYIRHRRMIQNVCRRYANSPMEVDDLLQDVFLKVCGNLHRFQGRSNIKTWLYRLAVNQALDYCRARRRRGELEGLNELEELIGEKDSEEKLLSRITVERLMSDLNEVERSLLTLYHMDGYTHGELAKRYGLTRMAVTKRMRCIERKAMAGAGLR